MDTQKDKIAYILSHQDDLMVEWEDPGEDSLPVTHSVSVRECIRLRKNIGHILGPIPGHMPLCDAELLLDFIAVHWASVALPEGVLHADS